MTARLLTYGTCAALLSCSERQVRRLISAGVLPAVRVGTTTLRVRQADLEAFVAATPATDSNPKDTQPCR